MSFCQQCGKELSEATRFCGSCGAQVSQVVIVEQQGNSAQGQGRGRDKIVNIVPPCNVVSTSSLPNAINVITILITIVGVLSILVSLFVLSQFPELLRVRQSLPTFAPSPLYHQNLMVFDALITFNKWAGAYCFFFGAIGIFLAASLRKLKEWAWRWNVAFWIANIPLGCLCIVTLSVILASASGSEALTTHISYNLSVRDVVLPMLYSVTSPLIVIVVLVLNRKSFSKAAQEANAHCN